MLSPTELDVQRKITAAFIAADVELIVLNRVVRGDDGAGGYVNTPTPLDPVSVRLIPQNDATPIADNNDGRQEQTKFELLAAWDADVAEGDWFMFEGSEYLIRAIQRRSNDYELKADVVLRGK
jgi:hypothetical protein